MPGAPFRRTVLPWQCEDGKTQDIPLLCLSHSLGQNLDLPTFLNRMGLMLSGTCSPGLHPAGPCRKPSSGRSGSHRALACAGQDVHRGLGLLLAAGPARPFLLRPAAPSTGVIRAWYHHSLCWWLLTPLLTHWGPCLLHRSAEMATALVLSAVTLCLFTSLHLCCVGIRQPTPCPGSWVLCL